MKRILIFLTILNFSAVAFSQHEAYYVTLLANKLNGSKEVAVLNGRVDIVTEEYAVEVEWAQNWKHSVGQALWYGLQTNKKPGIILIMKDINERKYGIMLQTALEYSGLSERVMVWFYPEDFDHSFEVLKTDRAQYITKVNDTSGAYSRNKNSGVRHNGTCAHFSCANCVTCGPSDGKRACGKCGG